MPSEIPQTSTAPPEPIPATGPSIGLAHDYLLVMRGAERTFGEIAALRGVSPRTVQRDWRKARLLLHRSLLDDGDVAGN